MIGTITTTIKKNHEKSKKVRLVGFDIVEIAPERDVNGLSALTAARIICNAIGNLARSK